MHRNKGIVLSLVKRPVRMDTAQGETQIVGLWRRDLVVRSWARLVVRRIHGGMGCRSSWRIWACLLGCRLNYPSCSPRAAVRGLANAR